MEKQWKQWQILFSFAPKSLQVVTAGMKWKATCSLEKKHDKSRQHIKKQIVYFASKGPYGQGYCFSSSHVRIWDLDHKEGWVPKNWCFWTEVLEKTLESPLDSKEIKQVILKGNQPWIFIGRAEAPILWPPVVKGQLIGTDPDSGKDWRQEEKGVAEDEIVGWHHWLNGCEFEQTPGDSEGQGSLVCCSPWSRKESDATSWLNNNYIKKNKIIFGERHKDATCITYQRENLKASYN